MGNEMFFFFISKCYWAHYTKWIAQNVKHRLKCQHLNDLYNENNERIKYAKSIYMIHANMCQERKYKFNL